MLIESQIKIGPNSTFSIHQTNFKSAHSLNKIALVQFQRNRTVLPKLNSNFKISTEMCSGLILITGSRLQSYSWVIFLMSLTAQGICEQSCPKLYAQDCAKH